MKLAYHTIGFHDFPLEYAVKNISELGYEGIELNAETNWAHPHITPTTPRSERLRAARLLSHHGLAVSSVCAHVSLVLEHESARAESMRFMRGCIDLAGEFGTSVVHAISGAKGVGVKVADAWNWLVASIGELVDYSDSRGVKFAFEAAVNQLVARSTDMEKLLRAVGGEKLHINFDPSHSILYGEDPSRLIRAYGKKIIHFHAKDSIGNPKNFKFPPLGLGVIDFGRVIDALKSIGYTGFVSVEYEGELFGYEKNPVAAARRAKRFLERML